MASYGKFQSNNMKYSKLENRSNHNPDCNPTVNVKGKSLEDGFSRNLDKYVDLISYYRFYPDLWYDLITPETGGIRLDIDQRVFLRCLARFLTTYGVFPRGYGKTMKEVMGMFHAACFFPDIQNTMTAQTRENAAKILEEKYRELTKFYPMLKDEIFQTKFSKDQAELLWTSGGRIDIMANHQSSKGARRHRLQVEESNLLNSNLYSDVLEPIVNVPRRTIGKRAEVNPEELNGQTNFFTTSGYRGTDEFYRSVLLVDDMAELKGKIVIGSDWQLACYSGRGETKSQILDKKAKLSPTFFNQNYCSKWTGSVDSALVDINKLLGLRSLTKAKIKAKEKGEEYILGVDVARSQNTSNNQSSVAIIEIKRNKNGRITYLNLVNLITISNALDFSAQALEIKKIKIAFNAKAIILDTNGLGVGLQDFLLKESFDPNTGESVGCWDTMNTDAQPEIRGSERCLYDLKPQSANSDIIVSFVDFVESGKLRLLEKKQNTDYDIDDKNNMAENIAPFVQTDMLIEEVANLQLKHLPSGKLTIEKVVRKYDKDRVSALMYAIWYIKTYEDNMYEDDIDDLELLLQYSCL